MSYSYEEIMSAQAQSLGTERAAAVAELEAARLEGDAYRVNAASDRILTADSKLSQLNTLATQHIARQQYAQNQPQPNKYGLNEEEQEMARLSMSWLSPAEAERKYAENKNRMNTMKANGQMPAYGVGMK